MPSLQSVHHLSPSESALVLLCGQVADAICTPVVGIVSDSTTGLGLCGDRFYLGRRQKWYCIGTILVAINYFLVFGNCLPCDWMTGEQLNPTPISILIYFSLAASLFNIGWAAVQVSHMSLVPELSNFEPVRIKLNSSRYSFTVTSNLLVFFVLFILMNTASVSSQEEFTFLAFTTIAVGIFCSACFLAGTTIRINKNTQRNQKSKFKPNPNPNLDSVSNEYVDLSDPKAAPLSSPDSISICLSREERRENREFLDRLTCGDLLRPGCKKMLWTEWLRMMDFYKIGFVYMNTRLVVNVSQVFIPFFVTDVLQLPHSYLSIIPCVVYSSSFIAAQSMKNVNQRLGRKKTYLLGSLLASLALVGFFLLPESSRYLIFLPSILLGFANSTIMVCSVQLEADLIGQRIESGAFVYGALSFTDKLSNGIVIFILQHFNDQSSLYMRCSLTAVPIIAAAAAALIVTFGVDFQGMEKRSQKDREDNKNYVRRIRRNSRHKRQNSKKENDKPEPEAQVEPQISPQTEPKPKSQPEVTTTSDNRNTIDCCLEPRKRETE